MLLASVHERYDGVAEETKKKAGCGIRKILCLLGAGEDWKDWLIAASAAGTLPIFGQARLSQGGLARTLEPKQLTPYQQPSLSGTFGKLLILASPRVREV